MITLPQVNMQSRPLPTSRATFSPRAGACLLRFILLQLIGLVAQAAQPTLLMPGSTVTLTVATDGTPPFSYQWKKNGATIIGATRTNLVLTKISLADVGIYSVVVTNFLGSVNSDLAIIAIPPVFTNQPANPPPVPAGGNAIFSTTVTSVLPFTLNWQATSDDGATWTDISNTIPGSGLRTSITNDTNTPAEQNYRVTTSILTVHDIPAKFHYYRIRAVATNSLGSTASSPATLVSSLVNLSVRALANNGNSLMTVGFFIAGGSEKSFLVRGIGPTLESFGVSNVLREPILSFYSGSQMLTTNNSWEINSNSAQIVSTTARLGAFALPSGSHDAVLLSTFVRGTHTLQLSGNGTESGIVLFELYDADPLSRARLVNVSIRTIVNSQDSAPIIGFVIAGNLPKQLLFRAIGPSLQSFGVTGALVDPQLTLYRQDTNATLLHNDNWGGIPALKSSFSAAGAFSLEDASHDAAVVATLDPGSYTAKITSAESNSGVVLIEVYELP